MKPRVLMNVMSNILYSKRFLFFVYITNIIRFGPYFMEPIICGFDPKTQEPFLASCDLIGCTMESNDFVAVGTSFEQLQGICESLWQPDMVTILTL